jgi:S1-C subfamily serine protease
MASLGEWKVSPAMQPRPADYKFDLDAALTSVVGLRATVPDDAFTAETLGTERSGHGVLIRDDGLILTIGYLVTEAEAIWLSLGDGRAIQAHALAFDQETGFGLVQALARLDLPALTLGQSASAQIGDSVVVGGVGGRRRSVAARIVAKQEFAGYWEYVLDEALFTGPSHPNWQGTALIGPAGELLGVGSLQLEHDRSKGTSERLNMIVPIDLLKPILDDLLTQGRRRAPPRPWLGLYATETDDRIAVVGLANRGPAQQADLRTGDIVLSVRGTDVTSLAAFFRGIWSAGNAGAQVPLTIFRDGRTFDLHVTSADRSQFFRKPSLH